MNGKEEAELRAAYELLRGRGFIVKPTTQTLDVVLGLFEHREYTVEQHVQRAWNAPYKWRVRSYRDTALATEIYLQDDVGKDTKVAALKVRGFKPRVTP